MKKLIPFIPFILLLTLAALFARPLLEGKDPSVVSSALVGKPMPDFSFAGFSSKDLKGQVVLVNFFASWCVSCAAEQDTLAALAKKESVTLYGIAYKDKEADLRVWLEKHGNPFKAVGMDDGGRVAIDFGVAGVPETFVVDRAGVIRYRHAGPVMPEDVGEIFLPLLWEMNK